MEIGNTQAAPGTCAAASLSGFNNNRRAMLKGTLQLNSAGTLHHVVHEHSAEMALHGSSVNRVYLASMSDSRLHLAHHYN